MPKKILILPGDGIGPEITTATQKVLDILVRKFGLDVSVSEGLIGGAAIDVTGTPLPEETLVKARESAAVLLGAVGGPRWEHLPMPERPEKGLLGIRAELGLFANLRPAVLFPALASASTLKEDVVAGLDIMIVRELTGGIYFGQPRGVRKRSDGQIEGFNTLVYSEEEIRRVARVAFDIAMQRQRRLCSVDKANVLEATELWREVVSQVAADYPEVELTHMYVDNAAMQLVRQPKQFDVIVTTNMFGDILSDLVSMLTGSIGMLPSASLGADRKGLYEPIHGSAPDIAGKDHANPLASMLSLAMLLRYSLTEYKLAENVEQAVTKVIDEGLRTPDIFAPGMQQAGTVEMGDAVARALADL